MTPGADAIEAHVSLIVHIHEERRIARLFEYPDSASVAGAFGD